PGGWMDRLENPRSCAQRELMEETGLSAEEFQVLEVFHSQKPHHVNIIFMTKLDSKMANSKIRLQTNEISDYKWYGPEDLPEPLSKHTYNALKKAWQRVEIPLKLDENHIVHTPF
ncbi:MAG: NUDIX domain-containing protein, partial [Chloroflexota bacterium]